MSPSPTTKSDRKPAAKTTAGPGTTPEPSPEIKPVIVLRMKKAWRTLRKEEEFQFRPGVNLVVGDQGCGKTSLLQALVSLKDWKAGVPDDLGTYCTVGAVRPYRLRYLDFYRNHPGNHGGMMPETPVGIASMMYAMRSSHGEPVRGIHGSVREYVEKQLGPDGEIRQSKKDEGLLFVLDEPCSGMSPRSMNALADMLNELSATHGDRLCFVVSTHSPILMFSQREVFDMERRRWTTSVEFLSGQKKPWKRPKWMDAEKEKASTGPRPRRERTAR